MADAAPRGMFTRFGESLDNAGGRMRNNLNGVRRRMRNNLGDAATYVKNSPSNLWKGMGAQRKKLGERLEKMRPNFNLGMPKGIGIPNVPKVLFGLPRGKLVVYLSVIVAIIVFMIWYSGQPSADRSAATPLSAAYPLQGGPVDVGQQIQDAHLDATKSLNRQRQEGRNKEMMRRYDLMQTEEAGRQAHRASLVKFAHERRDMYLKEQREENDALDEKRQRDIQASMAADQGRVSQMQVAAQIMMVKNQSAADQRAADLADSREENAHMQNMLSIYVDKQKFEAANRHEIAARRMSVRAAIRLRKVRGEEEELRREFDLKMASATSEAELQKLKAELEHKRKMKQAEMDKIREAGKAEVELLKAKQDLKKKEKNRIARRECFRYLKQAALNNPGAVQLTTCDDEGNEACIGNRYPRPLCNMTCDEGAKVATDTDCICPANFRFEDRGACKPGSACLPMYTGRQCDMVAPGYKKLDVKGDGVATASFVAQCPEEFHFVDRQTCKPGTMCMPGFHGDKCDRCVPHNGDTSLVTHLKPIKDANGTYTCKCPPEYHFLDTNVCGPKNKEEEVDEMSVPCADGYKHLDENRPFCQTCGRDYNKVENEADGTFTCECPNPPEFGTGCLSGAECQKSKGKEMEDSELEAPKCNTCKDGGKTWDGSKCVCAINHLLVYKKNDNCTTESSGGRIERGLMRFDNVPFNTADKTCYDATWTMGRAKSKHCDPTYNGPGCKFVDKESATRALMEWPEMTGFAYSKMYDRYVPLNKPDLLAPQCRKGSDTRTFSEVYAKVCVDGRNPSDDCRSCLSSLTWGDSTCEDGNTDPRCKCTKCKPTHDQAMCLPQKCRAGQGLVPTNDAEDCQQPANPRMRFNPTTKISECDTENFPHFSSDACGGVDGNDPIECAPGWDGAECTTKMEFVSHGVRAADGFHINRDDVVVVPAATEEECKQTVLETDARRAATFEDGTCYVSESFAEKKVSLLPPVAGSDATQSKPTDARIIAESPGFIANGDAHDFKRDGSVGLEVGMTREDCIRIGVERGFEVVGHRNSNHPDATYSNTCWGHFNIDTQKMSDWHAAGGNPGDQFHTTMTLRQPKIILESVGWNASAGPIESFKRDGSSGLEQGMTKMDCARIGTIKGVKVVGHRNSAHGDPAYRDTCWAHTDLDEQNMNDWHAAGGNPSDTAHTTMTLDLSTDSVTTKASTETVSARQAVTAQVNDKITFVRYKRGARPITLKDGVTMGCPTTYHRYDSEKHVCECTLSPLVDPETCAERKQGIIEAHFDPSEHLNFVDNAEGDPVVGCKKRGTNMRVAEFHSARTEAEVMDIIADYDVDYFVGAHRGSDNEYRWDTKPHRLVVDPSAEYQPDITDESEHHVCLVVRKTMGERGESDKLQWRTSTCIGNPNTAAKGYLCEKNPLLTCRHDQLDPLTDCQTCKNDAFQPDSATTICVPKARASGTAIHSSWKAHQRLPSFTKHQRKVSNQMKFLLKERDAKFSKRFMDHAHDMYEVVAPETECVKRCMELGRTGEFNCQGFVFAKEPSSEVNCAVPGTCRFFSERTGLDDPADAEDNVDTYVLNLCEDDRKQYWTEAGELACSKFSGEHGKDGTCPNHYADKHHCVRDTKCAHNGMKGVLSRVQDGDDDDCKPGECIEGVVTDETGECRKCKLEHAKGTFSGNMRECDTCDVDMGFVPYDPALGGTSCVCTDKYRDPAEQCQKCVPTRGGVDCGFERATHCNDRGNPDKDEVTLKCNCDETMAIGDTNVSTYYDSSEKCSVCGVDAEGTKFAPEPNVINPADVAYPCTIPATVCRAENLKSPSILLPLRWKRVASPPPGGSLVAHEALTNMFVDSDTVREFTRMQWQALGVDVAVRPSSFVEVKRGGAPSTFFVPDVNASEYVGITAAVENVLATSTDLDLIKVHKNSHPVTGDVMCDCSDMNTKIGLDTVDGDGHWRGRFCNVCPREEESVGGTLCNLTRLKHCTNNGVPGLDGTPSAPQCECDTKQAIDPQTNKPILCGTMNKGTCSASLYCTWHEGDQKCTDQVRFTSESNCAKCSPFWRGKNCTVHYTACGYMGGSTQNERFRHLGNDGWVEVHDSATPADLVCKCDTYDPSEVPESAKDPEWQHGRTKLIDKTRYQHPLNKSQCGCPDNNRMIIRKKGNKEEVKCWNDPVCENSINESGGKLMDNNCRCKPGYTKDVNGQCAWQTDVDSTGTNDNRSLHGQSYRDWWGHDVHDHERRKWLKANSKICGKLGQLIKYRNDYAGIFGNRVATIYSCGGPANTCCFSDPTTCSAAEKKIIGEMRKEPLVKNGVKQLPVKTNEFCKEVRAALSADDRDRAKIDLVKKLSSISSTCKGQVKNSCTPGWEKRPECCQNNDGCSSPHHVRNANTDEMSEEAFHASIEAMMGGMSMGGGHRRGHTPKTPAVCFGIPFE